MRGQFEVFAVDNEGHLGLLKFITVLAVPGTHEILIFVFLELRYSPSGVAHEGSTRVRGDCACLLFTETKTFSINFYIVKLDSKENGMDNLMPGKSVLHEAVRVVETESDFRRLSLGAEGEVESEEVVLDSMVLH